MKKIFLVVLLSSLFSSFAKDKLSGASVVVFNPDMENIGGSEATWLPGSVRDKLEENLRTVSDFKIVDNSNERKIKDIQKKSESAYYNEETSIEVGKLTSAKYALFSTVRKAGSSYTISLSFTDLTSGQKLATVVSGTYKVIDSLFSGNECAANEVTLKISEQLGLHLSAAQKYALQHGEKDLSVEEQLLMSKKEEENFLALLSNYDKELRSASFSTELSSAAKEAKLKAERALAEDRLSFTREQTKRLEERQQQKLQDEKEDAERSLEQRQKRDWIAQQASEKAAIVRAKKLDNESLMSQIKIIENKKRALIEIRSSVKERAQEINTEAEKVYEKRKAEIEAVKYRAAELANGEPTLDAIRKRAHQVDSERTRINSETQSEISKLNKTISTQEADLLKEIRANQKSLKKDRTVSSLSDDLKVSVGAYNGNTHLWPAYLYFAPEGNLIYQKKFEINYSDLSNKTSIPSSGDGWSAYADEIDLYNSWFNRGDLVYTYELDYSVEAMPDTNPSTYKFTFKRLRIIDTIKNKTVAIRELNESVQFVSNPIYDIRPEQAQQAVRLASEKEKQEAIEREERQQQKEIAAKEREVKRQEKKEADEIKKYNIIQANNWAYQTMGNGRRTFFGCYVGGQNKKLVVDLDMAYGLLPGCYLLLGLSAYTPTDSLKREIETSKDSVADYYLGLGINIRGHLGILHPNFFAHGTLGGSLIEKDGNYSTSSSTSSSKKEYKSTVTTHFSAGMDLPLSEMFALSFEYTHTYAYKWQSTDAFKIGLLLTFPSKL